MIKVARRIAILLVGASLLLALATAVARAHAVLVSTDPMAGARLGTAPGVVTLRFSEPVSPKLSTATVTDPTGRTFSGDGSGAHISVALATNAPGLYRVSWTSVSADDGHTERGSFGFTVVASSAPGSTGPTSRSPGSSVGLVIFRTIQYVAILMAIGILLIRRLARREPRLTWVGVGRILPWVLAVGLLAGVVVVSWEAVAAASGRSFHGVLDYLTTGVTGSARLVLLAAEGLALLASMASVPVWPFLLASVGALAASGHGASVRPVWWGISVDAAHLTAAGVWAGGIMALATLRPPGGYRGRNAGTLLDRFSPVAITAFLMTVGFGVVQAFQDVGSVHGLVATTYGRFLMVKVAGVAAMIPLSFMAWRRRLAPRAEGLVAVFVISAAAVLAAYPLPATQLRAARSAPANPAGSSAKGQIESAIPMPGDLTLGGHAGTVLVGLTLRPAKPGANQIIVYVLPLEGKAQDLSVEVSVEGRSSPVSLCGPNCRVSQADLVGGERITVAVGGSTGGSQDFDLPQLPAPDGSALLDQAQQGMHELRTFRLDEVLNSGLATVRAQYAFVAPNRAHITVGDESETILIGGTRYLRTTPTGPWQVEKGGPGIPVPSFIWDYFKPFVAPRILGTQMVDGQRTRVVSFFGRSGQTGVWFSLWVNPQGLVLQARMRADGHFMDHRYYDFNAPITVVPPVG